MPSLQRLPLAGLLVTLALGFTGCASQPGAAEFTRCAGNCLTHEDGYHWAQRGSLSDPDACDGYPPEFTRGCRNAIEDYRQLRPAATGW